MNLSLSNNVDGNLYCLSYLNNRNIKKTYYFSTAQAAHFFALFVLKIDNFTIFNCEKDEMINLNECKNYNISHDNFLKLYKQLSWKVQN
jgi:hypothetical protein